MGIKLLFDRNGMYIYPWYISEIMSTGDISKIAGGLKVKKSFAVIERDFSKIYYETNSLNKIGKYFLEKIINDKSFFKKVIKNIYKYSEELEKFCLRVDALKNVEKLSSNDLKDLYSEYIKRLGTLRTWGWVPVFIDGIDVSFLTNYISKKFKEYLKKIKKESEFSNYYSVLSSSEKSSEVQKEELDRLEMLIEILIKINSEKIINAIKRNDFKDIKNKYPDTYKLFVKHLKKFSWLTYAYSGPPMSMKHLFNLLKDSLAGGNIKNQRDKIVEHYKNIKKEKKEIIKNLSLPKDLIYLFNVSSELMFIKDYRKGSYQKSYLSMDKILEEIARRSKMTLKDIKYLVLPEIKLILTEKSKAKFYKSIVKMREKKCCYISVGGVIKVFEGNECEKMIAKTLDKIISVKKNNAKVSQLKGMIAYKGKVKGIAKIVLTEKDVSKINTGDILVSSATNPDLILAMKKAAAFVTDTGGIISHAAIVSRELKKPCIVGTKIATHVLKDGDLVEVDADKGIVNILKN